MNWPEIIKREKKFSSLELEKLDLFYEVWELGRVLAKILEVCRLAERSFGKWSLKDTLTRKMDDCFYRLKALYQILSAQEVGILGWVTKLEGEIDALAADGTLEGYEPDDVRARTEEIIRLISTQIKAKSVHLSNIFSFSLSLRRLKTRLLYELDGETYKIEESIDSSLELVDKLKLGDKVLASPNLEITKQNLKIIKFKLEGWRRFLPRLQLHYKKISSNPEEELEFLEKVERKCNLWTELILDIKNPSDYLSLTRKLWNAAVPLFVCYEIVAVTVVLLLLPQGQHSTLQDADKYIKFLVPLSIPLLTLYYRFYHWIKDRLVARSFRFRLSEFTR